MSQKPDLNCPKLNEAFSSSSNKSANKTATTTSHENNANGQQPTAQLVSTNGVSAPQRQPEQLAVRDGKLRKRFNECSYSVANLALIVASIVALIFVAKFFQDDILYEYIEHILSLAFYRELIFVLVIVPLVFLVPIYNALNACFLWKNNTESLGRQNSRPKRVIESSTTEQAAPSDQHRQLFRDEQNLIPNKSQHKLMETKQCVLTIKLFFEFLLIILLFIGLIFMAPNISSSALTSRIELELRKHLAHRYENNFSFQFLDLLQEQYQCCDVFWYRANMLDEIPLSCYRTSSNYAILYEQNCSEALANLISTRCAVIAVCLIILLISLAILIAIDIFHWLTLRMLTRSTGSTYANGKRYDFVPQNIPDARYANSMAASGAVVGQTGGSPADDGGAARRRAPATLATAEEDDLLEAEEIIKRLRLNERERQELISSSPIDFEKVDLSDEEQLEQQFDRQQKPNTDEQLGPTRSSRRDGRASRESDDLIGRPLEDHRASPAILTRANYAMVHRERSQSPAFLDDRKRVGSDQQHSERQSPQPIKGVLKKTSSFQVIDQDEYEHETTEFECESSQDYAEKVRQNSDSLLRHQQTRRSLLNVRFADP